ncbi:hypothetical protein [Anaerocolumna sp. MB42-C2]|uniref:hypothetical protein n=1 Tax=Anaerocolumna sp. MB42-C2 TaxID=3070997 RepID=UPI0027DECFCC|nr:hypothetical protein [Anaerocolumna sp. MB42-C2]WMJ89673.1 hypothetical protein RBU59_09125 [Anaerocolumna sp. MB42-C2]
MWILLPEQQLIKTDRALLFVREENFKILSDRLQDEQKKLRYESDAIKKQKFKKQKKNIQNFVSLIRNMKHLDELDRLIV